MAYGKIASLIAAGDQAVRDDAHAVITTVADRVNAEHASLVEALSRLQDALDLLAAEVARHSVQLMTLQSLTEPP